jgi:hypothetical protein
MWSSTKHDWYRNNHLSYFLPTKGQTPSSLHAIVYIRFYQKATHEKNYYP